MDDNSQMPFGKFAGEKMANVPASYLMWLWNNDIVSVQKWNRVYWYIHKNLDSLQQELKRNESFKKPQFT
jgi:uncharacterized protein (DUF3820 family)